MEEGGHPGDNELTTVVQAAAAGLVVRLPYVVGGGIGSGRQITAALAMGADGVVMGSRFITADEIWAHQSYKEYLASLDYDCSTTALKQLGTWRVLKNETVRQVQEIERAGGSSFSDFSHLIRGHITRDNSYTRGDWQVGMNSLGSAAGFSKRVEPMADIVRELVMDAHNSLERVARYTPRPLAARALSSLAHVPAPTQT
jgi:nitronate monooxygenase